MPKLLIIPGSLRSASSSRAVAHALVDRLADRASCTIADIGRLPHYNADLTHDPNVAEFIAQIDGTDGLIFVTPEYNYSIPGVLKNAIDWASRPAFNSVFVNKPCFVVTVSGGALGGVRAQAHLKYVLGGMLARLHPGKEVIIAQSNAKLQDGAITDGDALDFTLAELGTFLDSLG